MSTERPLDERIETAAESVGPVWPLHSFVTANPLAGFEDRPFHEAVRDAERTFGGNGYPGVGTFRRAWESGRIDTEILRSRLAAHGYERDPDASLDALAASNRAEAPDGTERTATDRVDAVLTKWLAAFLDQGQADWPMPNREQGFYDAFRSLALHDDEIPDRGRITDLPARPADTIRGRLEEEDADRWTDILEFHLTALPGWTGLLKRRAEDGNAWQSAHPITLSGYLAARLTLVDLFDAPLTPAETAGPAAGIDGTAVNDVPRSEVWLRAWEATYRSELTDALTDATASLDGASTGSRPDAQLVFCIDTRSEIIRRHVETTGSYETHGYAGFFGIPMRYTGYDSDVTVDACPPILDARHHIANRPREGARDERDEHDRWHAVRRTMSTAVGRLKSNAATAFSFVESAGAGYGAALAARTLVPERIHGLLDAADRRVPDEHEFCEPAIDHARTDADEHYEGLDLDEKVEYAATAFELMGWKRFARVVVFVGHAGRTANNPFDSSLDCGACAGNPGGPSARVLATICNDDAVRAGLRDRGIDIPEDTIFIAGEHDTTTDAVDLYAEDAPETHATDIERLRADLDAARTGAAAERADDLGADVDSGVRETRRRATDWAETRPEWGLAGNAGFVVGPRSLTEGLDLDGRSFLHSYDWTTDPEGDALEAIMTGPMIVTQWINAQYYFSTVDGAAYGSGSKVTHNPVGNVGVYQGNGGDLMTGLPLQSLASADDEPYHQPLRLSTVVHAPVERVTAIVSEHETLTELLDNGWLSLTVLDPQRGHRPFHYEGGLNWAPRSDEPEQESAASAPSTAADD